MAESQSWSQSRTDFASTLQHCLRYTSSTLHGYKFSSSPGYTFAVLRYQSDHKLWYFVPAIYLESMWMV